jgi:hypothetical protein
MSDAIPQTKPQRFANLDALHRQFEEMARTRQPGTDQRQESSVSVLVIRGK